MAINKENLINEIKNDLINQGGISRLSFDNPREREILTHY
mgnify:CR=1 FL=1